MQVRRGAVGADEGDTKIWQFDSVDAKGIGAFRRITKEKVILHRLTNNKKIFIEQRNIYLRFNPIYQLGDLNILLSEQRVCLVLCLLFK